MCRLHATLQHFLRDLSIHEFCCLQEVLKQIPCRYWGWGWGTCATVSPVSSLKGHGSYLHYFIILSPLPCTVHGAGDQRLCEWLNDLRINPPFLSWRIRPSAIWLWSTVMVHFMCQIDWGKECPDIWLSVISGWGVSVSVFLDEINIWIGIISQADCPPQGGWASSNLLKSWREWKAEWERILALCLMVFELGPQSSAFGLRLRLKLTPLALLVLSLWTQTETTLGSPRSGLLSLHNHVSQCLIINLFLYTSYYCCFSGEYWYTHWV